MMQKDRTSLNEKQQEKRRKNLERERERKKTMKEKNGRYICIYVYIGLSGKFESILKEN